MRTTYCEDMIDTLNATIPFKLNPLNQRLPILVNNACQPNHDTFNALNASQQSLQSPT